LYSAGDAEALGRLTVPESSVFIPSGELMGAFDKGRMALTFKTRLDAGRKLDGQLRHVDVKSYGNVAVVTGYVVWTTTSADGATRQTTNRFSKVLMKQSGQWMQVHHHGSPLVSVPSQ